MDIIIITNNYQFDHHKATSNNVSKGEKQQHNSGLPKSLNHLLHVYSIKLTQGSPKQGEGRNTPSTFFQRASSVWIVGNGLCSLDSFVICAHMLFIYTYVWMHMCMFTYTCRCVHSCLPEDFCHDVFHRAQVDANSEDNENIPPKFFSHLLHAFANAFAAHSPSVGDAQQDERPPFPLRLGQQRHADGRPCPEPRQRHGRCRSGQVQSRASFVSPLCSAALFAAVQCCGWLTCRCQRGSVAQFGNFLAPLPQKLPTDDIA